MINLTPAKQQKGGPRIYGESSHYSGMSREGERTLVALQLQGSGDDDRPRVPFMQTTRDARYTIHISPCPGP